MVEHILVRYGELTLKIGNRKLFLNALRKSMRNVLKDMDAHVSVSRDRAFVKLNGENPKDVIEALKFVSGILSVSPVIKIEKSEEALKENGLALAKRFTGTTFKVEVKRSSKDFHLNTYEIQRLLGGYILEHTEDLTVNVKNPDQTLHVEVRDNAIYMFHEVIPMMGGLPYNTGGKALLLLSGGIDSPVAGIETMRKGIEIEAVHFHSPPYTSDEATKKVKSLIDTITKITGVNVKLHIVPFTDIQTSIYENVPEYYSMTVTRRVMLMIAERLSKIIKAEAIVNGESLGQVASQTLTSMHVINAVTNYPVLRPLLTMDKSEIISLAQKYGTFETSILPYEDCCTIFKPKTPKTKPVLEKAEFFESLVKLDSKIETAINHIELYEYKEKLYEEDYDNLF